MEMQSKVWASFENLQEDFSHPFLAVTTGGIKEVAHLWWPLNFNGVISIYLAAEMLPVRIWGSSWHKQQIIQEAPSMLALHTLWHVPFSLTRAFFSSSICQNPH